MPTSNIRINLTIPSELHDPLMRLAQLDKVRVGTKALALLADAVEREEDALWTERADKRLEKKVKWISHKAMTKKYA